MLDTNVVLDWLFFHDPRVSALARAIEGGQVRVESGDCLAEEFCRVLCYPAFSIAGDERERLIARYLDFVVMPQVASISSANIPLRCRDADDQKFLQLAWRSGADLLTRDKALLVLGRRFTLLGGGRICVPESRFPPVVDDLPARVPRQAGRCQSGA